MATRFTHSRFDLVYTLAGDRELSSVLDEIDEPERTRRVWDELIEPDLRARGASDAEIEAERIACEVPAAVAMKEPSTMKNQIMGGSLFAKHTVCPVLLHSPAYSARPNTRNSRSVNRPVRSMLS